jgi:hypothetical protein
LATLDNEIARQDDAAALLKATQAELRDEVGEFLKLMATFGEHNGARTWRVSPRGPALAGWVIDEGTLLLTTDGDLLHYGHMHPDGSGGGPTWHDWHRVCPNGINGVERVVDLPDDLVQLLATTFRHVREQRRTGQLPQRAALDDPFTRIQSVSDPVERLFRAAYFVARDRHDYHLVRPVSQEDLEILCPEFFPAPVVPGRSGRWGEYDLAGWWAARARGVLLTDVHLIAPEASSRRLRGWQRPGGVGVEGWRVGVAGDNPRRQSTVAVTVSGRAYVHQRGRAWQPFELRPTQLRRMAELLALT